ncbi:MAG TPA: hypothetical protein VHU80_09765 [Polyangiaceae bacterium]|jgi:transposase-like protein|nr:hypothetical protein [Polyangiaceae bacterium]
MTVRQVSSLRAALASHAAGRGKRYPAAVKARIITLAQSRRREGRSWVQISGEVGVGFETLRRWCLAGGTKPSRAMVPVRVVPEDGARTVSVVSPSGHRVEGLTLQEAVAVLRALG